MVCPIGALIEEDIVDTCDSLRPKAIEGQVTGEEIDIIAFVVAIDAIGEEYTTHFGGGEEMMALVDITGAVDV